MKSLNNSLLIFLGYMLVAYVYGRLVMERIVARLNFLLTLFR